MAEWPRVSVMLPIYNERDHLAACFDSILTTDYPRDRIEILAVDGGSTDGTRDVIEEYAGKHPGLRLVENPRRIIPAALNAGLREATGEILIRMDAHALYDQDYVRRCVELLRDTGAAGVGGLQRHRGSTFIGRAVAAALRTGFGSGDAAYRLAEEPCWADTVYLGAWRTDTVRALHGWDETWRVNEDYEFNVRLREWHREMTGSEHALLLSPDIRSWYFGRDRLAALGRQYFRYGYWKANTVRRHPDQTRWRQLVPPVFVAAVLVAALLAPWTALPLVALLGAYAIAVLTATAVAASRAGWRYAPLLPVIFALVHFSWGVGFLVGVVRFGVPAPGRLLRASLISTRRPDRPAVEVRAADHTTDGES